MPNMPNPTFNLDEKVIDSQTNMEGEIVDIQLSYVHDKFIYVIRLDNGMRVVRDERFLERVKENKTYRTETQCADNVIIAIVYEVSNLGEKEVCRGHAHIIHEGAEGFVQACAYAYKRALEGIDTGIYFKQNRKEF
jgi:hypothetical protein